MKFNINDRPCLENVMQRSINSTEQLSAT